MRLTTLFPLILLFTVLGASAILPSTCGAATTWSIQTIDKNSAVGGIVALDSNNNPHIAYDGFSGNTVYVRYANLTSSGWNIQTVASNLAVRDLKIGADNEPYILCQRIGVGGLLLASWSASTATWSIHTVDAKGSTSSFGGLLALDSAGNPHVAYVAGNGDVKYASWTGSGWDIQTVATEKFVNNVYLALDSNNNPHILYGGESAKGGNNVGTEVKYAYYDGSNWSIQTVMSNLTTGVFGNLAVDSYGNPHFTYCNDGKIIYASWTGSDWVNQTVASISYSEPAYLVLDANNYPHIDYYYSLTGGFTGALMYAEWTGKTWNIQTVDPDNATASGSLILDSNGNPYIAYAALPPNAGQQSNIGYYLNYAAATETTQTSTSNSLVAVSLWIIAVLAVLAYVWKKKTKNVKKDNATNSG
jgi:hypothetical protein